MIVGDGMADYPLESLGGKTPLEAARVPHMDRLAREGAGGRLKTVPGGFAPASDVANLSLLGYDPAKCYSGRGPLEAASLGVDLEPDEVAFRCNLVTVSEGKLSDYSAGHISTREAGILINQLEERLGGQGIRFHPGMSYRHLLVVKEQLLEEGRGKLKTVPPHDITGEPFEPHLPRGKGGAFLTDLIRKSQIFLSGQEINSIRLDLGENPANSVWLWGEGKRPSLDGFRERFGLSGALISAVDLLKGLARVIGLEADAGIVRMHEEEQDLPANVTLIHADVLKVDLAGLVEPDRRLKIVANLPYSISSPFLFRLIDLAERMDSAVVMLQKEVAQRLMARPGTREYGVPTVLFAACAEVRPLLAVAPAEFHPRPKVDSLVVRIAFQPQPARVTGLGSFDRALFTRIVHAVFGQRRKTLLNGLAGMVPGGDKTRLAEMVRAAGIDPSTRAETLGLEDFVGLTRSLAPLSGPSAQPRPPTTPI